MNRVSRGILQLTVTWKGGIKSNVCQKQVIIQFQILILR